MPNRKGKTQSIPSRAGRIEKRKCLQNHTQDIFDKLKLQDIDVEVAHRVWPGKKN
jgi:hypothetical protein